MVVVVEGESREQIIPALDDVCRGLAKRKDLFGAVLHKTDAPKLRSKGLYYLEIESQRPEGDRSGEDRRAAEPGGADSCRAIGRN